MRSHLLALSLTLAAVACTGEVGRTPRGDDRTPPTVSATLPAADAVDVSVNTTVTVTFSEAVAPASVTAASFSLAPATSAALEVDGATVRLTPAAPLALSTPYTATLGTALTDLAGNPLAAAYTWSFTTAATVTHAATLTWEAPDENADGSTPLVDLAGYQVYHGTTSRSAGGFVAYDAVLDVGNAPICAIGGGGALECVHVLDGFAAGTTVYFAVTAYDTSRNESAFSNEASKSF